MKDKKLRSVLAAEGAVLAILLALVLGGCFKEDPKQPTDVPESTAAPATEVSTQPTAEPTEMPTEEPVTEPPTEPPTEAPTEPATEPTEPPTEPTTGGNTRPGGQGGYNPGGNGSSGNDQEEEKEEEKPFEAPQAGTMENPYVEDLFTLPDSFVTVQIPAGNAIAYEVYSEDALMVTVEDPEAYIIHNGVTYGPGEDGILTVTLTPAEPEAEDPTEPGEPEVTEPAEPTEPTEPTEPEEEEHRVALLFQIGNNGSGDKALSLSFTETLGGATNPEILEELGEIKVTLEEGDWNGYHYLWTATEEDMVTLSAENLLPEDVKAVVTVTVGQQQLTLRLGETEEEKTDAAETENEEAGKSLSFEVVAGDEVRIHVIALQDEEKNYPALETTLQAKLGYPEGSLKNPVQVILEQVPGSYTTMPIAPGEEGAIWVEIHGAGGAILEVNDPDAWIIYNETRYEPDEKGCITLKLEAAAGRVPVHLCIGTNAEQETAVTLNFRYDEGGMMAPVKLEDISEIQVQVGQNGEVYYSWIAAQTGMLQVEILDATEGIAFDVAVNNPDIGAYRNLSENGVANDAGTYIRNFVRQGDQVLIGVTLTDPTQAEAFAVTLSGFVLGTEESPFFPMEQTIQIPVAGGCQVVMNAYCYEQTLTIESESAYVIFGDQRYEPQEGVIKLTFPAAAVSMGRPEPIVFVVGNASEVFNTYTVSIVSPVGTQENPQVIGDFAEVSTAIPEGDSDGAWYYSWTADQTGVLHVSVNEATEGVEYDISLYNAATGAYMNLSDDGINSNLGTYVQNFVREGDQVEIMVAVAGIMGPDMVVRYPALDAVLSGYIVGTEESPMFVGEQAFTVPVADGMEVHMKGYCYEQTMTVLGETAYVIYDGNRYTPVEGKITVTFPASSVTIGRPEPLTLVIGNEGEYAAKFSVTLETPAGTRDNPEEVILPCELAVSLEEGNAEGYYFKWIAETDGSVSFGITQITENVEGDIVITNNMTGAQRNLKASDGDTVTMEVHAGDEIIIQLVTIPDEKDWSYPAADIQAEGAFTPAE